MGKVVVETEIKAPLEEVFAFFADPKNIQRLLRENLGEIEVISGGPVGVGTRFRLSTDRKRELEYVGFEKNRWLRLRQVTATGKYSRFESDLAFNATSAGTHVTDTTEFALKMGGHKILDDAEAEKDLERETKADYDGAKAILEKG